MSGSKVASSKELSYGHARYLAKELKERLRVSISVGGLVEELAEAELSVGKALAKIGTHPATTAKSEIASARLNSAWENAAKLITVVTGNGHAQICTEMSQNVGRSLPDISRGSSKRIHVISTRVQTILDDLYRAKSAHSRALDSYNRLVQETEAAIRNRYSAIESQIHSADRERMKEMNKKGKDDSFVHVSLNKMLAKMKPGDAVQRATEKCKDLLKEIDTSEDNLDSGSQRLKSMQDETITEINRLVAELMEIESLRLMSMREGAKVINNSQARLVSSVEGSLAALSHQIEAIHMVRDEELSAALSEIDKVDASTAPLIFTVAVSPATQAVTHAPTQTQSSSSSSSVDEGVVAVQRKQQNEQNTLTSVTFSRLHKLLELLDYINSISGSILQTLTDVLEVKKGYSKSMLKIFEKHGFMKSTAGTSSTRFLQGSLADLCASLLDTLESPTIRVALDEVLRTFTVQAVSCMKGEEERWEQLRINLEISTKGLSGLRKELIEKQHVHMRRLDGALGSESKLDQRLQKIRRSLAHRHEELTNERNGGGESGGGGLGESFTGGEEDPNIPAAGSSGSTPNESSSNNGKDGKEVSSKDPKTDLSAAVEALGGGDYNMFKKMTASMMQQGLDNFNTSLRQAKRSVVRGLEAPTDRIARLEAKIISLESEEREVLTSLQQIRETILTAHEDARTDIARLSSSSKETARHQLVGIWELLRRFTDCVHADLLQYRTPIDQARVCCDHIDLDTDIRYLVENIEYAFTDNRPSSSSQSSSDSGGSLAIRLQPVELFAPANSQLIGEERAYEASLLQRSSVTTSNSNSTGNAYPPSSPAHYSSSSASAPASVSARGSSGHFTPDLSAHHHVEQSTAPSAAASLSTVGGGTIASPKKAFPLIIPELGANNGNINSSSSSNTNYKVVAAVEVLAKADAWSSPAQHVIAPPVLVQVDITGESSSKGKGEVERVESGNDSKETVTISTKKEAAALPSAVVDAADTTDSAAAAAPVVVDVMPSPTTEMMIVAVRKISSSSSPSSPPSTTSPTTKDAAEFKSFISGALGDDLVEGGHSGSGAVHQLLVAPADDSSPLPGMSTSPSHDDDEGDDVDRHASHNEGEDDDDDDDDEDDDDDVDIDNFLLDEDALAVGEGIEEVAIIDGGVCGGGGGSLTSSHGSFCSLDLSTFSSSLDELEHHVNSAAASGGGGAVALSHDPPGGYTPTANTTTLDVNGVAKIVRSAHKGGAGRQNRPPRKHEHGNQQDHISSSGTPSVSLSADDGFSSSVSPLPVVLRAHESSSSSGKRPSLQGQGAGAGATAAGDIVRTKSSSNKEKKNSSKKDVVEVDAEIDNVLRAIYGDKLSLPSAPPSVPLPKDGESGDEVLTDTRDTHTHNTDVKDVDTAGGEGEGYTVQSTGGKQKLAVEIPSLKVSEPLPLSSSTKEIPKDGEIPILDKLIPIAQPTLRRKRSSGVGAANSSFSGKDGDIRTAAAMTLSAAAPLSPSSDAGSGKTPSRKQFASPGSAGGSSMGSGQSTPLGTLSPTSSSSRSVVARTIGGGERGGGGGERGGERGGDRTPEHSSLRPSGSSGDHAVSSSAVGLHTPGGQSLQGQGQGQVGQGDGLLQGGGAYDMSAAAVSARRHRRVVSSVLHIQTLSPPPPLGDDMGSSGGAGGAEAGGGGSHHTIDRLAPKASSSTNSSNYTDKDRPPQQQSTKPPKVPSNDELVNKGISTKTSTTATAGTAGAGTVTSAAASSGNAAGAVATTTTTSTTTFHHATPGGGASAAAAAGQQQHPHQQQQHMTMTAVNIRPEDASELAKFGLGLSDKVVESFSCALYPKKGLLSHGRMFITQHYLAFSGWPEIRILLPLRNLKTIEKCNTLYYIPNAIQINAEIYGEYFFGSFIDRDVCYNMLNGMSQVSRRLLELHGTTDTAAATTTTTTSSSSSFSNNNNHPAAATTTTSGNNGTANAGEENRSTTTTTTTMTRPRSNSNKELTSVPGKAVVVPTGVPLETRQLVFGVQSESRIWAPDGLFAEAAAVTAAPSSSTTTGATATAAATGAAGVGAAGLSAAERSKSPKTFMDAAIAVVRGSMKDRDRDSSGEGGRGRDRDHVAAGGGGDNGPGGNGSLEMALQRAAAKSTSLADTHKKTIATVVGGDPQGVLSLSQTASVVPLPIFDCVFDEDSGDGIQLSTLFAKSNITALHSHTLPFNSVDVWRSLWMETEGYGDFLLSEGDFDIDNTEWLPMVQAGSCIAEDIAHLPLTFSRSFRYLHPRTTMLMFGPKNAPATQSHYVYLPVNTDFTDTTGAKDPEAVAKLLRKVKPKRGVVITVTQMEGIPVADCFKVVQYWSFEQNDTSGGGLGGGGVSVGGSTVIRIGVSVHFTKSTMLKGQVLAGVKEELSLLSKRWCAYAEKHVLSWQQAGGASKSSKPTPSVSPQRKSTSVVDALTDGLQAAAAAGGAAGAGGGGASGAKRSRRASNSKEAIGSDAAAAAIAALPGGGSGTRWNFWTGLRLGAALVILSLLASLVVMHRYHWKLPARFLTPGSATNPTPPMELTNRVASLESELHSIREELRLSRESQISLETHILEMKTHIMKTTPPPPIKSLGDKQQQQQQQHKKLSPDNDAENGDEL